MLVTTDGTPPKAKGKRSKTKGRTPAEAVADLSLKDDRLVSTAEAATLLAVAPKTLREWRCNRTGPTALKFGTGRRARVVYRLSVLEAYVRASVTSVTGGDA